MQVSMTLYVKEKDLQMLVKNRVKKDWFFERCTVSLTRYFLSKYQFTNDWTEINTKELLIREGLKLEPIAVIEIMFPLIKTKKTLSEVIALKPIGNVGREDYSFGVFADAKVNDCVRLTSLEIDDYGLLEEQDKSDDYDEISLLKDINDSRYDLSLHSFNRFSGEFSLVGSFNGDSYDYEIACERNFCVKAIAWGILDSSSPAWIEYLVDASLNFQTKDYKMAGLNYFSAYENFVSIIHDDLIFDYLARKSGKTDVEMTDLRAFAQKRKRLSAKAISVAKFLNMYDDHMKSLVKKLDKYSEKRNQIAHGSATNINYDVSDMAYLIIAYMFCVGRQDNVLESDWNDVVN